MSFLNDWRKNTFCRKVFSWAGNTTYYLYARRLRSTPLIYRCAVPLVFVLYGINSFKESVNAMASISTK